MFAKLGKIRSTAAENAASAVASVTQAAITAVRVSSQVEVCHFASCSMATETKQQGLFRQRQHEGLQLLKHLLTASGQDSDSRRLGSDISFS